MTFQVAEVDKALRAVSNLVDPGRMIFDKNLQTGQDLSFVIKNTGVTSRLRRERNVWALEAFVKLERKHGSDNNG